MKNFTISIMATGLLLGSLNMQSAYDPALVRGLLGNNLQGLAVGSLDTLGALLLASGAYGKYLQSQRQLGQQYQPTFPERHYGKMAATGATLLAMSQALRRPETIGNLLDNAQALTANAYEKVGLLKDTALETGKAAGRIVQDTGRGWLSGLSDRFGKVREGFDYYTGRTAAREAAENLKDVQSAWGASLINDNQSKLYRDINSGAYAAYGARRAPSKVGGTGLRHYDYPMARVRQEARDIGLAEARDIGLAEWRESQIKDAATERLLEKARRAVQDAAYETRNSQAAAKRVAELKAMNKI